MDKRNVTLIGMPGCGKSTVGVLLAKALGLQFVDTDLLIQQKYKKFLWQLIEEQGIEAFKRMEAGVILSLDCEDTCVATGGSAVYRGDAMRHLKGLSAVVFIDLPCGEIERRVADIKGRGVVIDQGKTLPELYAERRPLYLRYADVAVDARGLGTEALLMEIIKMTKRVWQDL
ncbi:MAG: shikimate kinase [Oscillospiraceae bacterium]|jgi:shikimate kinase|nr:shikimate kinase [Oscillospiraceae bacterium]